jgi:hypothetical protein
MLSVVLKKEADSKRISLAELAKISPRASLCHPERSRGISEISPCASFSRDDKEGSLGMTMVRHVA